MSTNQELKWHQTKNSLEKTLESCKIDNLLNNKIQSLFDFNLVRFRNVLVQAIVTQAIENPSRSPILAVICSIINSKIPIIGKLVLQKSIYLFKEWKVHSKPTDNKKKICTLIAHLCNQGVCGELLPLEILLTLLESDNTPIECFHVAADLVKETGQHLSSRKELKDALDSIFERFRDATHERRDIPKSTSNMLNDLQKHRQKNFSLFPTIISELDLLKEDARIIHEISLDEEDTQVTNDNKYVFDPNENDKDELWEILKHEFLDSCFEEEEKIIQEDRKVIIEEEEEEEEGRKKKKKKEKRNRESDSDKVIVEHQQQQQQQIIDQTSHDIIAIKKKIYLTINHAISFEQVAHELLTQRIKGDLRGHDVEIASMVIECCAQAKMYTNFIGLLATRLCQTVHTFAPIFENEFENQYNGIHRLETDKIRNIATLLAQLLYTDCLSWPRVFKVVILDEETTNSSSRIYLKILFQRLAQLMGIDRLKAKLVPFDDFKGLFPPKPARRTRFAVNFFTSIGLGILSTEMREWLQNKTNQDSSSSSSSSSGSDSSSSNSSSSSSSSSDSESSSSSSSSSSDSDTDEDEPRKRRRRRDSSSSSSSSEEEDKRSSSKSKSTSLMIDKEKSSQSSKEKPQRDRRTSSSESDRGRTSRRSRGDRDEQSRRRKRSSSSERDRGRKNESKKKRSPDRKEEKESRRRRRRS